MRVQRNKVVIIGAGNVGSAILYSLLDSQSIAELVIIDRNEKRLMVKRWMGRILLLLHIAPIYR